MKNYAEEQSINPPKRHINITPAYLKSDSQANNFDEGFGFARAQSEAFTQFKSANFLQVEEFDGFVHSNTKDTRERKT